MALPVFDGHNDTLLEERSFADSSAEGHLDLARARAEFVRRGGGGR